MFLNFLNCFGHFPKKQIFKNSLDVMSIKNLKNEPKKLPKSLPNKNKKLIISKSTNIKVSKHRSALPKNRKKIKKDPSISIFVANINNNNDGKINSKTVADPPKNEFSQKHKNMTFNEPLKQQENDDSSFEWLLNENHQDSLNNSFNKIGNNTLPKYSNSFYNKSRNNKNILSVRPTDKFKDTMISEDLLIEDKLVNQNEI